jgi:hypothetical protein
LKTPEGEIDAYAIISGRRRVEALEYEYNPPLEIEDIYSSTLDSAISFNRSLESGIKPGKGWEVWGEPQGYCDGTYSAVCARQTDSACVLYGHHDE